ncbi:CHASE3 domain-containing protein [Streptomyces cyaneofuscatus]|uniref:sensor histidine kinase n=1 Tax=Streptomyces cyaneofuscatus TaxID=66883 RepID=UPI00367F16D1
MGQGNAVPTGKPERPVTAGWTTKRWLAVTAAAALSLLLALMLFGGWILARSTALNTRLIDHSTPALIAAVRLESALVDQETGIRGYGVTGQDSFLAPYREGLRQQEKAMTDLRTATGGDRAAERDLAEVVRRAGQWQTHIARPVAAAADPKAAAAERAVEGKALFDSVRSAASAQQERLAADRAGARADLQEARTLRNWSFSAIALAILALTASVFVGLRRGVTDHLDRLSGHVRTVAAGEFGHPVAGTGPADLRLLAADVESMRARLADELAHRDVARANLAAQAEELRRSNAELEQFAYVASHDLQEPLRKVASFCQLLERRYAGNLDERARQYIAFAVDGATRMQSLISDLLDFSRVGRLATEHQSVDLDEKFERTLTSLSLAVEESDAVVTHDPLPVLEGEPGQLGMLFQNLLTNAIKFRSPDRAPVVHLGCRPVDDGWEFAVTDNGIGIEAEFADRVFVVFQRLHTREQYAGNGIGLALCKKIVEYHGGTIAVDPAHSPGTRIVFTLRKAPPRVPLPRPLDGERGPAGALTG